PGRRARRAARRVVRGGRAEGPAAGRGGQGVRGAGDGGGRVRGRAGHGTGAPHGVGLSRHRAARRDLVAADVRTATLVDRAASVVRISATAPTVGRLLDTRAALA